jgi:hypothetical protein
MNKICALRGAPAALAAPRNMLALAARRTRSDAARKQGNRDMKIEWRHLALGLAASLLLSGGPAAADVVGSPLVTLLAPQEYGASELNADIAIAPQGDIYVTNEEGLLRYRGGHWTLLRTPDGRDLVQIERGPDGRFYYSGFAHAGVLQENPDGSVQFEDLAPRLALPDEPLALGWVWQIIAMPDGLWFVSEGAMVWYSPADHATRRVPFRPDHVPFVHRIGNRLFTRVQKHGLYELVDDAWVPVPGGDAFADISVSSLHVWRDGMLAIASDGFHFFRDGVLTRAVVEQPEALRAPFKKPTLDIPGGLLVGAASGELLRFDSEFRLVDTIRASSATVRAMDFLPDGSLLVATEGGIALARIDSVWRSLGEPYGLDRGVQDFDWHDGALWVASSRGLQRAGHERGGIRVQAHADVHEGVNALAASDAGLMVVSGGLVQVLEASGPRTLITDARGYVEIAVSRFDPGVAYAYCNDRVWLLRQREGRWQVAADWRFAEYDLRFGRRMRLLEPAAGSVWIPVIGQGPLQLDLDLAKDQLRSHRLHGAADGVPPIDARTSELYLLDGQVHLLNGEQDFIHDGSRFVPAPRPAFLREDDSPHDFTGLLSDARADYALMRDHVVFRRRGETEWTVLYPDGGQRRFNWGRLGSDGVLRLLDDGSAVISVDIGATAALRPLPSSALALLQFKQAKARWTPAAQLASTRQSVPMGVPVQFGWGLSTPERGARYRVKIDGLTRGWTQWMERGRFDVTFQDPGFYRVELAAVAADRRAAPPLLIDFDVQPAWYATLWVRGGVLVSLLLISAVVVRAWLMRSLRRYRARQEWLEWKLQERDSDLVQLRRRLVTLTVDDAIDGLADRSGFERLLRRCCANERQPVTVMLIALHITNGEHTAGLLMKLRAELTKLRTGPDDIIGRYSASVLGWLLPGVDRNLAYDLMAELRMQLHRTTLRHSVHFGMATGQNRPGPELLAEAEADLARAGSPTLAAPTQPSPATEASR